jgi:hypothetical protein
LASPRVPQLGRKHSAFGSITKQGSDSALAAEVHQACVPTPDAVVSAIKPPRLKTRVAVMRRLTAIFWHMLGTANRTTTRRPPASPVLADRRTPRCASDHRCRRASGGGRGLCPQPRDLSLLAPCEGGQPATEAPPATAKKASLKKPKPRSAGRKKTSGRSSPSALRNEPGAGAQVASQQSPILPSG